MRGEAADEEDTDDPEQGEGKVAVSLKDGLGLSLESNPGPPLHRVRLLYLGNSQYINTSI